MHVIVSDEIRQQQSALEADPIIVGMARAVYNDLQAYANLEPGARFYRLDTHDFMVQAERTYVERGGTLPHTIGGPSAAIRALLNWDAAFPPEGR